MQVGIYKEKKKKTIDTFKQTAIPCREISLNYKYPETGSEGTIPL